MNKQEQIKSYWNRIDKLAERIEYLANKGLDWSKEMIQYKNLVRNVKNLESKYSKSTKTESEGKNNGI